MIFLLSVSLTGGQPRASGKGAVLWRDLAAGPTIMRSRNLLEVCKERTDV